MPWLRLRSSVPAAAKTKGFYDLHGEDALKDGLPNGQGGEGKRAASGLWSQRRPAPHCGSVAVGSKFLVADPIVGSGCTQAQHTGPGTGTAFVHRHRQNDKS